MVVMFMVIQKYDDIDVRGDYIDADNCDDDNDDIDVRGEYVDADNCDDDNCYDHVDADADNGDDYNSYDDVDDDAAAEIIQKQVDIYAQANFPIFMLTCLTICILLTHNMKFQRNSMFLTHRLTSDPASRDIAFMKLAY
ncbi:hypothetical protein DPMN_167913 [Dreissena polymorpha]|uniref:Uncharacterized protein n=1 Tax=Dreissena polymorpha TaxID=45954 RepID=A0A9D4IVF7_DREPO|nr:hypothetical protein DPMN_167913 [Dreissena polymorpha]